MTDEYRALMQDALRELRRARQRIADLELSATARHEPIAIVGLGCSLPHGIEDPDALWHFLARGGDAIAPPPPDRWPEPAPAEPTPPGAFVADPFGFDARFFRIAPREARVVDPQQRRALEVAHATLEHAGLAPAALCGSDTGVFVGISTHDWSQHLTANLPVADVDGACGPGTNPCAAAGRISFALGLEGPSLAVNTACSSSLVALHLAVQALRQGECELALVLGVNLMLSPLTTLTFRRAGMLAKDGRCKTFAADADGYGRGEGAVGVLLARPHVVRRRQLRVHAEVLGSAVNQDGATAGLTVPSGRAQQRVVRKALADAQIAAAAVGYVEAHGTGTLLGDPIELAALAAVYGADRAAEAPLFVASVKTNFGHLEAAAGLLGVLKTVLQLERGELVPHRNCAVPNPHVPWAELPFRVPRETTAWPAGERRIAGVSSFSFTGTNAHVVLGSAATPIGDAAAADDDAEHRRAGPFVLPVGGRTEAALRANCRRWAEHLAARPELPLADVAATAAHGRSPMRWRTALVADDLAGAARHLGALAAGDAPAGTWTGAVSPGHVAAPVDATAPPAAIAAAFVAGDDVPWQLVYPAPFRRLPLPTYAFQRRTYRVPFTVPPVAEATAGPAIATHVAPGTSPDAAAAAAPATDAGAALRQQLASAPAATHGATLTGHVVAACARVLRLAPDEIDPDEPLAELGFDSLRTVELQQALERDLDLPLPLADLLDRASAADVGHAIAARWATARSADDALLREIASLSEADAEARLRETDGDG